MLKNSFDELNTGVEQLYNIGYVLYIIPLTANGFLKFNSIIPLDNQGIPAKGISNFRDAALNVIELQ